MHYSIMMVSHNFKWIDEFFASSQNPFHFSKFSTVLWQNIIGICDKNSRGVLYYFIFYLQIYFQNCISFLRFIFMGGISFFKNISFFVKSIKNTFLWNLHLLFSMNDGKGVDEIFSGITGYSLDKVLLINIFKSA